MSKLPFTYAQEPPRKTVHGFVAVFAFEIGQLVWCAIGAVGIVAGLYALLEALS